MEEVLKERLKHLEEMVAKIPVGIYVFWIRVDGHMEFEYVSDQWCNMHLVCREDVMSDVNTVNRLIHKDDIKDFLFLNHESARNRKKFVWEGRLIIGCELRWFRIESIPEVFHNGDIRWFGFTQDITETRQAHELGSKLKSIMTQAEELAQLGSWEWNIQNDSWILSENWKRIHGVSDVNLTTSELLPIAHPEDRPSIEKAFARAVEYGKPYDIEHRIIRQDNGEIRYVSSRGLTLLDSEGKPEFMVGAVQDITERKQAEKALRESEEKFRSLADTAKVAIDIVADCRGTRRLYVNDEWTRIHGYSKEEALDLKPIDLVDPDYRQLVLENAAKRMQGKQPTSGYEIKTISKSGDIKYLEFSSTIIKFDNQNAFLTTAIDITKRKLAEEALKKSEAKLRDLNNQKDKFFSIIAHDLRNPFSAIIGLSELLTDQIKEKDYKGIEMYANLIGKSTKQAMNLLMNLLDWSRAQTGGIEFNPEKLELVDLIEENKIQFNAIARQKAISVKKYLPNDITVYADRHMISTVIRNLISNAIKFTGEEGEIKITADNCGEEIIVSISDNGVGIDPERIEKIFRIDDSESTPGTNNEKGTGLGLILCKEFVEKHGGKIWVESEQGKGSSFYFTLFCNAN